MKHLTEKLIPELRFPEFDGEWKETKLGEMGEFYNGLRNKNKDSFINGNRRYIQYLDIFQNPILNKGYDNYGYVFIREDENQNEVKYGDLLFTQSSETIEEVGFSSIYLDNREMYLNSFSFGFRFNFEKQIDFRYIGYLFRSSNIRRSIIREGQGSTRFNLSSNRLKNVQIFLPSLQEQEKIGCLFSNIDKKIELQSQRIDKLKEYKKGILQRVFNQEVRFKDENGNDYPEWEEKKLGEMVKYGKAGGTPKTSNPAYYNGNIPFLSIADMTRQGKFLYDTEKYITEEGLENSSAWIVPKNSIIYSMYASIGFASISKVELATSQAMYNLILDDDTDIEYIYYYLNYIREKEITRLIETGTQGNLNASLVRSILVEYPLLQEQEKIANFLSSIDKKIKLEEEKLELQQEYKKGLMQRMFI